MEISVALNRSKYTTWKVKAIAKKPSIWHDLESERESVKLNQDICLKKNASFSWYPKNRREIIALDWTFSYHPYSKRIFAAKEAYDYVNRCWSCYQTVVTASISNAQRIDGITKASALEGRRRCANRAEGAKDLSACRFSRPFPF